MQTITLDGKEYVLVPKEQLQPAPQVVDSPPTAQESYVSEPEPSLMDFIPESGVSVPKTELATAKERSESIRLVDQMPSGVPSAVPKKSDYYERYKRKALTPMDVTGFAGMNPRVIQEFTDVDEIEADKQRSPGNRMFYGPGVEFDVLM